MVSWLKTENIHNHTQATGYVSQGRDGIQRPLAGNKYIRIKRTHTVFMNSPVSIYYASTPRNKEAGDELITWFPDRTVVQLRSGNSYERYRIKHYTGLDIRLNPRRRKYGESPYLLVTDPTALTPPKLRKCRSCQGSGIATYTCYGYTYCYHEPDSGKQSTHKFRQSPRECPQELHTHWHYVGCEHAPSATTIPEHRLQREPAQACWGCGGTGTLDHGSKITGQPVDRWAYITIHPDGRIEIC